MDTPSRDEVLRNSAAANAALAPVSFEAVQGYHVKLYLRLESHIFALALNPDGELLVFKD